MIQRGGCEARRRIGRIRAQHAGLCWPSLFVDEHLQPDHHRQAGTILWIAERRGLEHPGRGGHGPRPPRPEQGEQRREDRAGAPPGAHQLQFGCNLLQHHLDVKEALRPAHARSRQRGRRPVERAAAEATSTSIDAATSSAMNSPK